MTAVSELHLVYKGVGQVDNANQLMNVRIFQIGSILG